MNQDKFIGKYMSRNFHLSLICVIVGSVALFTRFLAGGEYVTLALGVLTAFRAGDVVMNWIHARSEATKDSQ